jgi:hypothetical protein
MTLLQTLFKALTSLVREILALANPNMSSEGSFTAPCVIYLQQRIMLLAIWLMKPDRLYLPVPRLNAENVPAGL